MVGDGFLGLIHVSPDSEIVEVPADLALFVVLFTDGMHVSFRQLGAAWRNPMRALGLGLPLAIVGMAVLTHFLVGPGWVTSFLVGAVLEPTDPVFASAIVGRAEVAARLRQLLGVVLGVAVPPAIRALARFTHANPYLPLSVPGRCCPR